MTAASAHRRAVFTGTLYALAAGLMWGLVFIVPTLLAEYSAALLTVGRYLALASSRCRWPGGTGRAWPS